MAAGLGIGRFVYTPILPVMTHELDLSQGQAGLIASANFLGYLVGALIAASSRFSNRPRRWLLGALVVNALAMAVMGLDRSMGWFVFLRFVGGSASAFILVFAAAIVLERLARAGRPDLSSVHFAGVGVGIAVSAIVVAVIAGTNGGWASLWTASAAAAGLGLLAVMYLVPAPGRTAKKAAKTLTASFSTDLVRLITAYGLFGFGYVITATFLVAIVRADAGLAVLEPVIWVAVGIVAVPSVAIWNWAGQRVGIYRAYALACLAEAAGVLASVLWVSKTGAIAGAVLLGGTFMGITALGLIAARDLTAGDARRNLGLMTAAFGLGQIIGPAFAGAMHDRTDSFVLASIIAAVALGVAALLVLPIRAPQSARS